MVSRLTPNSRRRRDAKRGVGRLVATEQRRGVFAVPFLGWRAHIKMRAIFGHLHIVRAPVVGFAETHSDHRRVATFSY